MMRFAWVALVPALAMAACAQPPWCPPAAPAASSASPGPAEQEARNKARYQIVHAAPFFGAMVLLDTATGQTWKPCPRADLAGSDLSAWCEMVRGEYLVPPPKAKQ